MTYILLIRVDEDREITVGKLGNLIFKKGFYFYIGSARKWIEKRIKRHISKDKRRFWHIDSLLLSNNVKIKEVWLSSVNKECKIAKYLSDNISSCVKRFGSSDCSCQSHLFFADKNYARIKNLLKRNGFKNASKDYL